MLPGDPNGQSYEAWIESKAGANPVEPQGQPVTDPDDVEGRWVLVTRKQRDICEIYGLGIYRAWDDANPQAIDYQRGYEHGYRDARSKTPKPLPPDQIIAPQNIGINEFDGVAGCGSTRNEPA